MGDTCLQRSLDPAVFACAYGLVVPAYVGAIVIGALLAPVCVATFGLSGTFVGLGCAVLAYSRMVVTRTTGRAARVVPGVRRMGTAGAIVIALALAGASVAGADTPSPSAPVHADAAGVARAPFVAGDIERLSQIPSGTDSIVLERVLQDLYAALFISRKTASVHVSNIISKLDVSSRGEAAAVAHRLGIAV